MLVKTLLAATALAQAATAAPAAPPILEDRQTACQSVHVFIARGSTEPYPGRQGALADAICSGVSGGCGYEDIQYPATFENYCASAGAGVKNGLAQITAYAQRCPNAKLVLTGYSQGGHVVSDILGGGGGTFPGSPQCTQGTTGALSPTTSPGNKIAAALFFGDVRHTPSQSYNVGTAPSSAKGIWPRTGSGLSALNAFSSKLRSWCDAGDPACASGNNGQVHTGYFQKYVPDAAAWAKTKL
ncbi:hypothetical protein PG996_010500 [Apiospora saccharicola]|uniref:Cutinase n=1 Tax=Apiospora saccharicola TaxID=335842 RepID=A0ABR1UNR6_9PEZI